ncbi:MAG: Uma2 family endonuclease [Xanthobacteraceae bacterium]
MAGAMSHPPIFSVAMFRDWITSRPDEQHWELIEGVPVMMAAPTAAHQRIVTNLEVLLNDALAAHDPSLEAYHDVGVNIVSAIAYDPEPDVVVVRRPDDAELRYFDEFYLAAEVLSESDRRIIESKRAIYRAQTACACILMVRQDRLEVTVDLRTAVGWQSRLLHAGDELALPAFGLRCQVDDLYRRTAIR